MMEHSGPSYRPWKCFAVVLFLTLILPGIVHGASNCRISTRNLTLSFGTLDPFNPANVTLNGTATLVCGGNEPFAFFMITDDDGLHETGPDQNRMQNSAFLGEYIPYSFSIFPASGTVPRQVGQPFSITATVLGMDYQNAAAGMYADIVTLTITP